MCSQSKLSRLLAFTRETSSFRLRGAAASGASRPKEWSLGRSVRLGAFRRAGRAYAACLGLAALVEPLTGMVGTLRCEALQVFALLREWDQICESLFQMRLWLECRLRFRQSRKTSCSMAEPLGS